MAREPPPNTGPKAIGFLYPRFSISGTSMDPSMAVEAQVLPHRTAIKTPLPIATKLNLPDRRPSNVSRASIRRVPIPEWNSTSPMRRNRGTGSMAKNVTDSNMLRISCSRPDTPPQKIKTHMTLINRKQNAIGSPVNISSIKPQKIISRSNHHSNSHYLFTVLLLFTGLSDSS